MNDAILFLLFSECEYVEDIPGLNVKIKTVTFHKSKNSSEWYAQVTWSPFTGKY